jgi:iron transport multicopper oxidase
MLPHRWFFNSTRYSAPGIPSIYTALTSGDSAMDPLIYGATTNPFVLSHNSVVELVISNRHNVRHPFHLHGHNFQVVYRSPPKVDTTFFASGFVEDDFPRTPIRRDTLLLENQAFMVLRFRADNPGVWLFHCHMEWHVETGLVATMVEAPLELQKQYEGKALPAAASSLEACHGGEPVSASAGNEEDKHESDAPVATSSPSREEGVEAEHSSER